MASAVWSLIAAMLTRLRPVHVVSLRSVAGGNSMSSPLAGAEGTKSEEWEHFFVTRDYPDDYAGNPATVREICSLFSSLRGCRVLEVGPGSGADSSRLAALGAHCVVLDPARTALARIQTRYPSQILCTQGDGFAVPFLDQSFDVVFSQGLLEHFPDPLPMLAEQIRVTKPGGFIIADVPQSFSLWTLKKKALMALGKWFVSYETQYTEGRLQRLVSRLSGTRVVRFYGHKLAPSWLLPQPKGAAFERGWLARHICVNLGAVLQRTH